MIPPLKIQVPYLPLVILCALFLVSGMALLNWQASQARDTIRKHHLDDIEQALYYARRLHGTYPPYSEAQWCGALDDDRSAPVRSQIETELRAQNATYAKVAKPFPTDPTPAASYFYWKHSPAIFELYAILEANPTGERNTLRCLTTAPAFYDYGLTSIWREPTD